MIFKFVLKNFRRRKVRTILIVLSLLVSTGLTIAMSATVETIRRSNVNLITSSTGNYDLAIHKTETSQDLFLHVSETSARILAADKLITAVYPRFLSQVELNAGQYQDYGILLAIDPSEKIGRVEVLSGDYQLGNMQAAVLQSTALSMGNLQVGDTIEVAYNFPKSRQIGSVAEVGSSQRRAFGQFTISAIIRQNGVANAGVNSGLIIDINDAQMFLGLPDRAEQLIALVEPSLYDAGNAEEVALRVRDVAVNIQAALGNQHVTRLDLAMALDDSAETFLAIQALISTFGLMSLGMVGLLVYTLVMTNVQEQRREMAILRILGSQRQLLFGIVVVEVLVVGVIGIGLGIIFGQGITVYAVVPLIEFLMSQEGQVPNLQPAVSLSVIFPAVISAFVILIISAIKPAQDAAKTKVIHAINPGVADNIQLEDLDELRERRPTYKLFIIGLGMTFVVLMVAGIGAADTFGNPAVTAALIFAILIMTVMGIVFIFFIFTRPLEKLILFITGLISPKLTFFAKRNVGRSPERNTFISLLILFSGVLPSFLATFNSMVHANISTDVRLDMGAPIEIQSFSRYDDSEYAALSRLRPSFVTEDVLVIPGIETSVGLTYEYPAPVSDAVNMRSGRLSLVGVSGDLNNVLYEDLIIFSAGGRETLSQILTDPNTVVISQGMAEGLAVPLGGTILVEGEGLDHKEELTVVGIAQRLPGFNQISRIRNQAMWGGTVLISLEGFQRVTTNPQEALPNANSPLIDRVLATVSVYGDPSAVQVALHETFNGKYDIWTRVADVELKSAQEQFVLLEVLLLVLTIISFITAVFGVFAVIYVTVYSRRKEIGMMKAIGAQNSELNGMLSVESIAMTLSAAIAGILAGSMTGYLISFVMSASSQRPQQFVVDVIVMPFIIIMVLFASIMGTMFSARRIVKHKAVDILRMS